jgi:pimeloyl-ACP methyl ester carboxylesterase
VSPTFVLIPGAGGSAWYWHPVTPLLSATGANVVAVGLPAADDSADLSTYADVVCAAADLDGPVVLVAQSMGAFTAPVVVDRLAARNPGSNPVVLIVLVNPMVPAAGETPGQWWEATGQHDAMAENFRRMGLPDKDFDQIEDFFHDVPAQVREEAFSQPEPGQSDTPMAQVWPCSGWPDVPTRVVAGSDDRLFPLEFQRRVVRDRLGLDVDVLPGGHLMALSHPRELAEKILSYLPS